MPVAISQDQDPVFTPSHISHNPLAESQSNPVRQDLRAEALHRPPISWACIIRAGTYRLQKGLDIKQIYISRSTLRLKATIPADVAVVSRVVSTEFSNVGTVQRSVYACGA